MTLLIRDARPADEAAVAALHARSWRSSYRGLLPDDYLDHEVVQDRAERWSRRFAEPEGAITLVAEEAGEMVGFAHTVIDLDDEWGSLLDNLHAHPDRRGVGIGRRLLLATAERLLQVAQHQALHLWVLEGNQDARSFYEVLGGELRGSRVEELGGDEQTVVRYVWPSVGALAES